jgi:hypothetical protein
MFPADAFQAQYLESREAAIADKRTSALQQQQLQQQRAHILAVTAKLNALQNESSAKQSSQQQQQHQRQQSQPQPQPQQQFRPNALGPTLMQRPNLSRSTSSQTVLGNILQGFNSRASAQSSVRMQGSVSGTATPMRTPLMTPIKNTTQAELEAAMLAERKRDADIVSLPLTGSCPDEKKLTICDSAPCLPGSDFSIQFSFCISRITICPFSIISSFFSSTQS